MTQQMTTHIAALNAQYLNPNIFRFARTQRDAGIELFDWECRLKPLRSISQDIGVGIGAAALAAGATAVYFLL